MFNLGFVSIYVQIYVVEAEDDRGDEERADRDKRKIAVAKLGVSNGIINFVFNVRLAR